MLVSCLAIRRRDHSRLRHLLSCSDIEENGVRLRLNVVDTPGFGDFVNNSDS